MQVPKRSNAVSGVRTPIAFSDFIRTKSSKPMLCFQSRDFRMPPHYGKFVASYRISTDRQWPNGLGLAPTRNDSLID